MKVKSESEVAQSRPTLCDPMDSAYQAPPPMGIFQARVLDHLEILNQRKAKDSVLGLFCSPETCLQPVLPCFSVSLMVYGFLSTFRAYVFTAIVPADEVKK